MAILAENEPNSLLKADLDPQILRRTPKRIRGSRRAAVRSMRVTIPPSGASMPCAMSRRCQQQATSYGAAVGRFAAALLDSPLPWTRMRRVYALLGLTRRYGAARVNDACTIALAVEKLDVHRLKRMLELGQVPPPVPSSPARVIPLARFLRPASQYALPLASPERPAQGEPDDH